MNWQWDVWYGENEVEQREAQCKGSQYVAYIVEYRYRMLSHGALTGGLQVSFYSRIIIDVKIFLVSPLKSFSISVNAGIGFRP